MECAQIPKLRYGEFSQRFNQKVSSIRIPAAGSMELTFRCNLRCKHCYVSHGLSGIPGKQELTYSEIQRIIDEVVDEGCFWFLLTGGEPLIRRDFQDIYLYAKKKGLLVTLFTNGTMLTPNMADFLAEWRPFSVEITLYGHTQETYEKVTGIPGSHARCRRGIDLLLERGIPLKLKTMVMTLNQHELWDMKAFAEGLELDFRYDAIINPGIEEFESPLSMRIPPEDFIQLEQVDDVRSQKLFEMFNERAGVREESRKLYRCSAGVSGFHIDPYGKLSLCMLERRPGYDLRNGSFHEGWNTSIPLLREQEYEAGFICTQCDLRLTCPQCPAISQLENKDYSIPVDYICQITHLRAKTFRKQSSDIYQ